MTDKKEGEKESLVGPISHEQRKAMRNSVKEGAMVTAGDGFGDSFITPYALVLGSNSFHIGVLSSLTGLISPIGELFGSRRMDTVSRKRILLNSKRNELFFWFLMMSMAFFAWKEILPLFIPYALIVLYALISFMGGTMHPAWFSWMGDIVPEKIRGRFLGMRNRVLAFVGIIAFLAGSFVLDYISGYGTQGALLLGFSTIFLIASVFMYMSRSYIKKIYDPPISLTNRAHLSFWKFLKNFDNYGKLALFQSIFYMSIMIASPFFAVYMLTDLNFNYVTFTLVSLSSTLFFLFFTPIAGKFSDVYGNIKLLYFAGFLFPFVPLLWVFLTNPILLFILPGLISGVASAAYSMGVTDYTYELLKPEDRGIKVAYSSVVVGLGVFVGSLAGGYLIQYVPIVFMNPIKFVFVLSAIAMFLTSLIFIPMLREVRKTKKLEFPFHHHSTHHRGPFKGIHTHVAYYKNNRNVTEEKGKRFKSPHDI